MVVSGTLDDSHLTSGNSEQNETKNIDGDDLFADKPSENTLGSIFESKCHYLSMVDSSFDEYLQSRDDNWALLSDKTMINGKYWSQLKMRAMRPQFKFSKFWVSSFHYSGRFLLL